MNTITLPSVLFFNYKFEVFCNFKAEDLRSYFVKLIFLLLASSPGLENRVVACGYSRLLIARNSSFRLCCLIHMQTQWLGNFPLLLLLPGIHTIVCNKLK